MTNVTMICPGCEKRVVMREHCPDCGVFAMARALYVHLKEIDRLSCAKDASDFVARTRRTDELIKLHFVRWDVFKRRFVPTTNGWSGLERLQRSGQ